MSEDVYARPDNCLAGFECPQCYQFESFRVQGYIPAVRAVGWAELFDDGTDMDTGGDFEFGDDAGCECTQCSWKGTVGEARPDDDNE